MSDFNTKLDEIATRLYEAGGIDRELNGYNEERVTIAKQAIIDLIDKELIGEAIPYGWDDEIDDISKWKYYVCYKSNAQDFVNGYNRSKAEQRNILKGGK